MLLPYTSDRPPRQRPLAVVILVLFHFAVFGATALAITYEGTNAPVRWFAALSLVPVSLRWWAPFSYSFLHDSVPHLSANMLFLWVFGGSVEDAIGWRRFALLYMGAAVATGMLEVAMAYAIPGSDRAMPIVGASGAVSALVGVFAVRFYRSRVRFIGLPGSIPAVALLAVVLLGEMTYVVWGLVAAPHGPSQATAHWAHIGGFVLGMLWAQGTRLPSAARREYMVEDATDEAARGTPLSAAHRWQEVLADQPTNVSARAELARAWALAGDPEQSLEQYRVAIAAWLKVGSKRAATECFLEMRGAHPDAVLPPAEQLTVASALEEQGHSRAALAAFADLLCHAPAAPEAEMAQLRAGAIRLRRLGEPEEAAREIEAFLARYPASPWRDYAEQLMREARRSMPGNDG
jgi:membrane associated rhomboid family serine protease